MCIRDRDYTDLKNLKTTEIEAERFLHDGGLDSTKRYFITAANARGKLVVIDTKEGLSLIHISIDNPAPSALRPHPSQSGGAR